ncbi:MAG: AzlC family ABC transporter permease [Nocardioidaceae bacterium]|nr:AzlC family ABC transporter permease [Nocardioidaceae bacterium]NUS49965.1 AzlC family ABC transporter permease [Nocardioidaceae bacterium]
MRSTWRTLLATLDPQVLRDIALVCVADALVGLSFGAIAVSGGLDWTVPVLMSLLVFAGGAQFAAVAVVLSGGSAVAAVLAGLVLNSRLLPFGFAVSDVLGRRWRTVLPGAHVLTDESVAFAMRETDPARRRAAFWVCGLALFGCWNVAVVVGSFAGRLVRDTDALGLDAAFPAVLLALVLPALSDGLLRAAALLGAVVAMAAVPFVSPGIPVLLALLGLVVVLRRRDPEPAAVPEPCEEEVR